MNFDVAFLCVLDKRLQDPFVFRSLSPADIAYSVFSAYHTTVKPTTILLELCAMGRKCYYTVPDSDVLCETLLIFTKNIFLTPVFTLVVSCVIGIKLHW